MNDTTRRLLITLLSVLFPIVGSADQRPQAPARDEVLFIDGSKNPELVPQWSIWEYSFGLFGGGKKLLPTVLHLQLSEEERAIVIKSAEAHLKREAAFHTEVARLQRIATKETAPLLDEELHRIKLEYRRSILAERDRLLATLSIDSRLALAQFVDARKASRKITMLKSHLAAFLQPE